MAAIGRTGRSSGVNEILKNAENTLNQINDEAKKGKNISPQYQSQFEEIKQSFQKLPEKQISGQAEDLDENLQKRVLKAIDLLEHQQTAQKIPNIMSVVQEVKAEIQLLKKGAKVERGGKTQLGGGKGGGA